MLAINAEEIVRDTSNESLIWDKVISEVTHYGRASGALTILVGWEHERRGYGKRPTSDTVRLVIQACEDEGIFGLGT